MSENIIYGKGCIRYKRTTEVRGSNPTEVAVRFFSEMPFSKIHIDTTARPQAKPQIGRHPSYIMLK